VLLVFPDPQCGRPAAIPQIHVTTPPRMERQVHATEEKMVSRGINTIREKQRPRLAPRRGGLCGNSPACRTPRASRTRSACSSSRERREHVLCPAPLRTARCRSRLRERKLRRWLLSKVRSWEGKRNLCSSSKRPLKNALRPTERGISELHPAICRGRAGRG